jgi:hypothetical protein
MEPEGSLLCLQEPSTGPKPEPELSSAHSHLIILRSILHNHGKIIKMDYVVLPTPKGRISEKEKSILIPNYIITDLTYCVLACLNFKCSQFLHIPERFQ